MLIVDLEAGAESAQGGFGMARFSDRLRAPSKRKKDAISFEISTPSGSFGGWGINLWASAGFTRSQVSAREISRSGWRYWSHRHFGCASTGPRRRLGLPAGPELAESPFYRTSKEGLRRDPSLRFVTRDDHPWRDARFTARVKRGLGEIPHSGSFGRFVTSSTR
jgi:hypothetical protein